MNLETQQALSRFAVLVDPKIGIIRSVDVIKLSEIDPSVYLAHAEPCDTIPLAGIAAANRGAACARDADRAVLRACGECVERYCSAFFDFDTLRLARPLELAAEGKAYVSTGEIYPFAESQYAAPGFPYERVTPHTRIRWIRGQTMVGMEVWIPASCVFVPYLFESGVEPFTHMPISTGLAAGPSLESCIDKGVCEIIERDALMIIWYARIAVPRIDPLSCYGISPEIDALLGSIRTVGTSWLINCLTVDVDIPVVSAALVDEGSTPLTSFGIAANMDPTRALQNALEEAVMTRLLVNRSSELLDSQARGDQECRTLRDHLLAHAGSEGLIRRMQFLTSDGPWVEFKNVGWSFDSTITAHQKCREAGFEPVWTDITTPDVSELGFKVVRTIMAGMQPLDNDHRYRHLGGARLLGVPQKLGYELRSIEQLNQDPHPFP